MCEVVKDMSKLKCYIELELRDKDGRLIQKRKFASKTYVKQGLMFTQLMMSGRSLNLTTVDGASYSVTIDARNYDASGSYGSLTKGIVIGTSDTPYAYDQYKLQNVINHGSSGGQMLYGVQSIDTPQSITNGYRLVLSRVFTNSSGASITVKEVGLYYVFYNTSISPYFFACMQARDVITPTAVANGQSLTVRYIFTVSST
jgi:hypothetical protein